jgi:hypothetical protein
MTDVIDAPSETPYDSRGDTVTHIQTVRRYVRRIIEDLDARAAHHDASKLKDPEKEAWDRGTPELSKVKYGTQEYRDSFTRLRLTEAVNHHYRKNDHHPEFHASWTRNDDADGHPPYWVYDNEQVASGACIARMDLAQLTEMLCDWKAAGERMQDGGNIYKSIDHNVERFGLTEQLADILRNTARSMGW